ncbi:hypothetical protein [Treponema sp.]|uniref:hypothetical protein n=1 Tax=Treponema sp. TaxID=166 RepID=UPI0025CBB933|nr:hypothetical protein [Treponema sp.]MCR5217360.1 hypothetical protein [Treponema sp.]
MKKICKAFAAAVFVLSAFGFTACNDAIVDDGSNVKSYIDNAGSGGGAVPFKSFEGCDLQIWVDTFTATQTSEAELFTVGSVGWWGGAFVNKGSVGPTDAGVVTYDMSNVATITFEAMISEAGSIWVSTSASDSTAGAKVGKTFSITTEWDEYTFNISDGTNAVSDHDYGVFAIGGSNSSGTVVYIKNIAFYDASGNEIVPGVND